MQANFIEGLAKLPADLQHIAETFRGQQADPGALAFQNRVCGDRGAMDKAANLAALQDAHFIQAADGGQHRLSRIIPRRGQFQDLGRPTRLPADHIRERAADVDADFNGHAGPEIRRQRQWRRGLPTAWGRRAAKRETFDPSIDNPR